MEREIKLSEAIREGAKLRPMCQDRYFGYVGNAVTESKTWLGSCALGAAYEAITGETEVESMMETLENVCQHLFSEPWLESPKAQYTLAYVIYDMNDSGRFTREEIADWLESIGE